MIESLEKFNLMDNIKNPLIIQIRYNALSHINNLRNQLEKAETNVERDKIENELNNFVKTVTPFFTKDEIESHKNSKTLSNMLEADYTRVRVDELTDKPQQDGGGYVIYNKRKYKVRIGKRSGKYILVGERKIYI